MTWSEAESRFWLFLEYEAFEAGGEIERSGRPELEGWWCDGMEPDEYVLDGDEPYIAGEYFGAVAGGPWRFRLDLRNLPRVSDPADIDWDALHPVEGCTGWLTIDLEKNLVGLDFSVRDEPVTELIERKNYPPSVVARDEPTPESDAISGDAWRSYRTTVHERQPESRPANAVANWDELRQPDIPLTRSEFWDWLQRRIAVEMRYAGRVDLIGLEPDGIAIDAYELDSPRPRAEGTCWLRHRRRWGSSGPRARSRGLASLGPYRFVLDLKSQPDARSPGELDFEALLPSRDGTGWLTVDPRNMVIAVDPTIAETPTEEIAINIEHHFWILPSGSQLRDLTSDPAWRHLQRHPRARVHGLAED